MISNPFRKALAACQAQGTVRKDPNNQVSEEFHQEIFSPENQREILSSSWPKMKKWKFLMMAKVSGEKLVYCFLIKGCILANLKNLPKMNMALSYVTAWAAPLRPQSQSSRGHIFKKQAKETIN